MLLLLLLALTASQAAAANHCRGDPDSSNWPEWPPILTDQVGDPLLPQGDDNGRYVEVREGQPVLFSCPGAEFSETPSWLEGPLTATCAGGRLLAWVEDGEEMDVDFKDLGCTEQPANTAETVGSCGPQGLATEILIGFDSNPSVPGTETTTLTVCHDLEVSRTLWSRHTVFKEQAARDHGNDSPPFNPDDFFDYDVNHHYTMVQQKITIAGLVGSQDLADEYVQEYDTGLFLARGHLAPNADFIFYSWMDATYHFINVAPQWQAFNGKNWMYFENGVRDFAIERELDLVIYTGTHGVCELEDVNGDMVEIHLYQGDRLPVPRFYWKILYDPAGGAGVAVVGVNNPHLKSIPAEYLLCPALEDHPIMDSVYYPDTIEKGYMWACRVEDLAAAVEEVPAALPAMELLV